MRMFSLFFLIGTILALAYRLIQPVTLLPRNIYKKIRNIHIEQLLNTKPALLRASFTE